MSGPADYNTDTKGFKFNVIGVGGSATVYSAICVKTGQRVALKVSNIFTEYNLADARNEAARFKALVHLHVIRYYDSFLHTCPDGSRKFYIVLDLAEADLKTRFLSSPSDGSNCSELRLLIGQLALALHYVHSRKLVHRDIKPANLLLTPTGRLVLADFGLVREDNAGGPCTLVGTWP